MSRPTDAEILAAIGRNGWAEININPDWHNPGRAEVTVEWRTWHEGESKAHEVRFATRDSLDDALLAVVEGAKP